MAKRGSGPAVGYIRGRLWKGKWTPDAKLQRARIKEFADENEYEIIKIDGEQQKFSLTTKAGIKKLGELVTLCDQQEATFLYVDIGNWRPNVVLNSYVNHYKRRGTKKGWKFVAVPPNREVMEAIERQARVEKLASKKRTKKTTSQKKEIDIHPIQRWQKKSKIGMKRLKNYEHLHAGVAPIYKEILRLTEQAPRLSNKRIAWALDREAYLTVGGERWNDETVRKVRKMIVDKDFSEFLRLKEIDEVDKYDI